MIRKSEWLLTFSLLSLLFSLFVIAKLQSGTLDQSEVPPIPMVKIEILGSVSKPGEYLVEKGSPLRAAIQKAKPTPFANLREFDLAQPVEASQVLELRELSEIVVTVDGALEQITQLRLPPKTRVCQIKRQLSLLPEADLAQFKSRRYLKDGEKITIPFQVVDKKS